MDKSLPTSPMTSGCCGGLMSRAGRGIELNGPILRSSLIGRDVRRRDADRPCGDQILRALLAVRAFRPAGLRRRRPYRPPYEDRFRLDSEAVRPTVEVPQVRQASRVEPECPRV